jgi:rSAM/selenodomain-associated transferase 1
MVDVPGQVVVALLTRAPSRGGKSRLFAALGRPPDPALLEALLLDTLDGARLAGTEQVVAVEPGEACGEVRPLVPPGVRVAAQPAGTLGDRMRGTMDALFAEGAALVVLIGSDLPDITQEPIAGAISLLSRDPDSIVLGPAVDGGYYLVAGTRVPPIFDGIEWGSARVLDQTRSVAARLGLRVHLIEPMRDVDTLDDLRSTGGRRTREWVTRSLDH